MEIPADPAAYHGQLVNTAATDRSHNGSIAVPATTIHGRHLETGEAVVLTGAGRFGLNSSNLPAAIVAQIRDVVAGLRGRHTVTCEGYTDYGGAASQRVTDSALCVRFPVTCENRLKVLPLWPSPPLLAFATGRPGPSTPRCRTTVRPRRCRQIVRPHVKRRTGAAAGHAGAAWESAGR